MLALATLAASLLASCGGDDEGYPPFEMTYTVSYGGESESTWELDYRSPDDWTKTLIASDVEGLFSVGNTVRWDGERIAWAASPEGWYMEDQSPQPNPSLAFPERWFGYRLAELPNDLFEEVEAPAPDSRRFRNEFPVGESVWTEIVTFERETGVPIAYEMSEPDVVHSRFEVVSLEFR